MSRLITPTELREKNRLPAVYRGCYCFKNAMVMVVNLYSAFQYSQIQNVLFTSNQSVGETGHQHIQAPLTAAISPLAISPNP